MPPIAARGFPLGEVTILAQIIRAEMARDDELFLTEEELQLQKRARRRRIVIVALLVCALAAGVYYARPTYRAIKSWQARRHAEKAFAFIQNEKWTEARDAALAAYQLRPNEPESIRAVARFLSRVGQTQALEFWDRLAKTQPLTREDLHDEATVALGANDLHRAERAIERLLSVPGDPPGPADWLLAARVAKQGRTPERAHEYLDKIAADPTSTEGQQFSAALMRLALPVRHQDGSPQQEQAEAWARVVELSRSQSAVGIEASLVLARQVSRSIRGPGQTDSLSSAPKEGESDEPASAADATDTIVTPYATFTQETPSLTELADRIEKHPLAKPDHSFLAFDLRLRADPSQKENILAAAMARWKDTGHDGAVALAGWLNGNREYARVLELVPLEKAMESRETFLQYVDALAGLARWEEIRTLLESERFPLDPVLQRMYLARCNAQLGNKAAAENNWERALEVAGTEIPKLLTLANFAEKNGAIATASAAYEQAVSIAPRVRSAQQGRLRTAQHEKDTRRMHAILSEMLRLWPGNLAIQNDEAYIRLLLLKPEEAGGEGVRAIEQLAEKLVQKEPRSLPHRTLLALARLKQNNPQAAMEPFRNIQVPRSAASVSALAVNAAVLAANGHAEAAQRNVRLIPPNTLLPEEQSFLPAPPG